ncbi:MAG: L-2-amino-thiazoline-4-carboxylic acid hydrolase [Firmicutes bacterium]|nr:L-2-amino-thiazoline-4-carboxylic acid hydrolase [Bacillota bacterium]
MFSEMSHAFIAGMYYNKLKEKFGDNGVDTFRHATQQAGLQRGHRMALKALRDGKPLDIFTYREYGELIRTPDAPVTNLEVESTSPDYVYKITSCPWHVQFEKMGALEAGACYCAEIDEGLYRGFNPAIGFTAPCNLSRDGFCRHVTPNVFLDEAPHVAQKNELAKTFDFHCAHLYWCYSDIVEMVFGEEGKKINKEVLEAYGKEYGEEAIDVIMSYEDYDFNAIEDL